MSNSRETPAAAPNDLSDELDTDFRKKYPPDPVLGQEAAESARVWKVYRGEAIEYDDAILQSWNDTVNILLTFAGLFSAAVTSFVLQSFQQLQPDPNAELVAALYTLLATSQNSATTPPTPNPPSTRDRWVNGLWFISLFVSLGAALMCILVKQWLDEYTARTRTSSKNAKEWALRHALYFRGMQDWHVPVIISILPLILHLALFLFSSGLVLFIWEVEPNIRRVLLCVLCLLAGFYLFAVFIPFWSTACPFSTPLVNQLRSIPYIVRIRLIRISIRIRLSFWAMRDRIRHVEPETLPVAAEASCPVAHPSSLTERQSTVLSNLKRQIKDLSEKRSRQAFDRALERDTAYGGALKIALTRDVLDRLLFDVSDTDAVAVALQSLPALYDISPKSVEHLLDESNTTTWPSHSTTTVGQLNLPEAVRAAQSLCFLEKKPYIGAADRKGSTTARSDFVRHVVGRSYEDITSAAQTFIHYPLSIEPAYAYLLLNHDLNRTDVLHMLSCVDLRKIRPSLWSSVTRVLAAADSAGICDYADSTWHGSACGSTCVLAYLVTGASYRDEDTVPKKIRRALIGNTAYSSLPLHPDSSLFGFFISSLFRPKEHSDFPIRAIASILPFGQEWAFMVSDARPGTLFRAAVQFLDCDDHRYDVYGFVEICRSLLDVPDQPQERTGPIPADHGVSLAQRASTVSDWMLYPLPDRPSMSLWQEFHAKSEGRPLPRILLFDSLSTALCSQEVSPVRDARAKAMLDIVEFNQYVADAFGLQCDNYAMLPRLVRIWQHCIALDSTAWSRHFTLERPGIDDSAYLLSRHSDYIKANRPTLQYAKASDLYDALRAEVESGPCSKAGCRCEKPAVWPPHSQAPLTSASQSIIPTTT